MYNPITWQTAEHSRLMIEINEYLQVNFYGLFDYVRDMVSPLIEILRGIIEYNDGMDFVSYSREAILAECDRIDNGLGWHWQEAGSLYQYVQAMGEYPPKRGTYDSMTWDIPAEIVILRVYSALLGLKWFVDSLAEMKLFFEDTERDEDAADIGRTMSQVNLSFNEFNALFFRHVALMGGAYPKLSETILEPETPAPEPESIAIVRRRRDFDN